MIKRLIAYLFILVPLSAVFVIGLESEARSDVKIKLAGRVLNVEVAKTPLAQEKGLSGRAGLKPGSSMLFVFPAPNYYGFWMKDMKFSIDIIWVEQGKVVEIAANTPPDDSPDRPIYRPREPASLVIEVPAGFSQKYGLKVGDRVEVLTKSFKFSKL